jgi:serine/threonine-protein kinase
VPLEPKKVGELVEGYRVMKELGRGAASIIYVVNDPKTKQIRALKHIVKDTEKDQRWLDQAEQEYMIGSKLNSDSIRKIERIIRKKPSLLAGVNELYLVMELVDGASCEYHQPKNFEDAVYVFEQVAQGLAHMHDKGFVHADMKPNNIIVDEQFNAKIIDLGQSCKIGTVKQRIQGTPDYIAPEQVHLKAITPKTDVYNLGASMYWIVTKTFVPTALSKGDSLLGTVDATLLAKPKPPIELNPRVPQLLNDIIMQCVEVDPDDRPEMKHVADRLNFIRSRLIAEAELRKSGGFNKVDSNGTRAAGNSRAGSKGGSSMGPNVAGAVARHSEPPPIDPGPGIEAADD